MSNPRTVIITGASSGLGFALAQAFLERATASRTSGCANNCASTSPNSIRKPRSFIWWSIRPRYSR